MPRHYFGSISRSQVISDLLLLLTRSIRNKKQCNSHFHEMEKHFPNTRAEMTASKLIESIVSINFTQCSPYSRQHRLLEFLSKKPLEFGSGLSILESFNDILSPTLLSMLGNIHITLNDDNWAHFPWKLFHRETMPGLKTLHLDLAFSSWEKQGWASTLLGDNMQSIAMDIGTDIFLYTKNMSNKDSMEKMLAVKKSWPRWIMTTPDCCLLTTSDRREQINPSLPP